MGIHLSDERSDRNGTAPESFDFRPGPARGLAGARTTPAQDPASVTYGPDAGSSQWMNGTSNTIAIIVEREVATPEDYGAPRCRSSRL